MAAGIVGPKIKAQNGAREYSNLDGLFLAQAVAASRRLTDDASISRWGVDIKPEYAANRLMFKSRI
jgi:hypothetical protein